MTWTTISEGGYPHQQTLYWVKYDDESADVCQWEKPKGIGQVGKFNLVGEWDEQCCMFTPPTNTPKKAIAWHELIVP